MRAVMIVVLSLVSVASAAPKAAADPVAAATSAMAEADFDKALAVLTAGLKKPGLKQPMIAKLQRMRGEALVALQRLDEATVAFSAALAADPSLELDPTSASPDAVSAMDKARRQILSELTVSVTGAAADIKIDGDELGPAPLKTKVGAGTHKVEAVAADGHTVVKDIEIKPGVPLALTLELPAAVVAPGPAPTLMIVTKRPAASSSSGKSKLGFIPLGVGVAAAGAGVVFLVQARGKHDALVNPMGPRLDVPTEQQLVSEGGSYQTLGFVLMGVGAAAAVAGTAMLLFMSGSSSRVAIFAAPSTEGGVVGLSGRF